MQQITYRLESGHIATAGIILVLWSFMGLSCQKKEAVHSPPVIVFSSDSGFTTHDTILVAGAKIRLMIRAQGYGGNITYFSIRYNDGAPKIVLDTGMNRQSLTYYVDIIKTSSQVEKWTFVVMDRNRLIDSVGITLTKSDYSKWGKIRTLPNVKLGAQQSADTNSFFSFNSAQVFTFSQAFLNQGAVDMIYYYGLYNGTFASPSEAEAPGFFTGPQGIAGWSVKNETRYDTTAVSSTDFDLALNDSLLLSAYDPTAGKRKAKFLQPGMVISFKSPAGKLGLINVTGLTGTTAGSVKFSIKIQE